MNEPITKAMAKKALGFSQDTQLASFFGTSKQAVGRWPEDDPLPDGRQWQARALRPDLFGDSRQLPANDEPATGAAA
ncbi:hypothetical protein [Stenotrophomonas sp. 278]|uniref:hypothetical protein n=1 Tax=Stenotrophomonas sp. 278 TaxID=2479851 RepID=UPI000F65FD65|nr:hypothetical protein [Stenotrophomonas sp. 278]RRU23605.1 hypothetical protein EGJ34_02885 [Stenotrophomonas sp. 278]